MFKRFFNSIKSALKNLWFKFKSIFRKESNIEGLYIPSSTVNEYIEINGTKVPLDKINLNVNISINPMLFASFEANGVFSDLVSLPKTSSEIRIHPNPN